MKVVSVTVRVTEEEKDRIIKSAQYNDMNMSEFIRCVLEQYMNKHAKEMRL